MTNTDHLNKLIITESNVLILVKPGEQKRPDTTITSLDTGITVHL